MPNINEVIDSLSEEELDILNSDDQLMSEFKAKYSGQPSPMPQQPEQGFMGKTMDAYNKFNESPVGSLVGPMAPINAAKNVMGATTNLFNKAGEGVTEYLGKKQVNHILSAGAGTAVSMVPDIALSGGTPTKKIEGAVGAAVPLARRALGFQKSMLKTPFARGQATKAAETALENKIIPYSGNPTKALENASNLASNTGAKIGETLKSVPAKIDTAMNNLEAVRGQLNKGFSGGVFQKAESLIDDVKTNLMQLAERGKTSYGVKPILGKESTANSVNQIKTRLARSINYLGDLAAQADNKAIVNSLANSIRESVKAVLPAGEYVAFIKNQKLFGMSEFMKKGLNNEVAGQMGNRMFSPYSVIPAAGEIAAGNPMRAAAALGLTEGVMRRGAGQAARTIQEVGENAPALAYTGARAADKILTRSKAVEFLKQANGNKDKARQLAEQAGYDW